MKVLRQYKGQLFFTLILLLIILAMPFRNYMEHTLYQGSLQYPEEAADVIQHEEEGLIVGEHTDTFTLYTDNYDFQRGTYLVVFNVLSEVEGNTVEIWDPLFVNPDNTSGKLLSSADIPVTGENIHMTLRVDDYSEYIQFRIQSKGPLKFSSIYLLADQGLYRDPYLYGGLLLLGSALILIYRSRKKMRLEVLLLLGFTALWTSLPLCLSWLMDGHDLYFHYSRLFNLSEGLSSGMFPVRIHAQMWNGFTYMNSIFYPEFFLYPFALLGLLGMSPMGCYQFLLLCINFATAGLAYYSFSRLCRSRKIGLIAAVFYTLSMYRLIDLYTRAAIGEAIAFAFLPLLMLGMYHLFLGDSRRWYIAVLAFTGLLQSHIVTTELAICFSLLFGICCIRALKDRKRLLHLIVAAIFTILLNLWFLIPLLDHMRYPFWIFGQDPDLSYTTLYLLQVLDTGMNNLAADLLGPGLIGGEMPYSIGLVFVIGTLLFLFTYLQKKKKNFHFQMGFFCLLLGLLSIYAASSYFPWKAVQRISWLRFIGNIQFPFRFLPFATVFLCLTSALGVYHFFTSKEARKLLFLLCGILMIYSSGKYFNDFSNEAKYYRWDQQMEYAHKTDMLYLIGIEAEKPEILLERDTTFLPSDGITLRDCSREGTKASFTYTKAFSTDAYVDLSFHYYPYFRAYDSSGNALKTSLGETARLRVHLPPQLEDTIFIQFQIPLLYRVCDLISLFTALLLLTLGTLSWHPKLKKALFKKEVIQPKPDITR